MDLPQIHESNLYQNIDRAGRALRLFQKDAPERKARKAAKVYSIETLKAYKQSKKVEMIPAKNEDERMEK